MPLVYRSAAQHSKQPVKKEESFSDESSDDLSDCQIKQEYKEGNQGKWEDDENLKFAIFIAYYQPIFASRHQRKHSKIFKSLAKYLGERTPPQCRSHFQKLLIKHKTAAKIKKFYRQAFGAHRFDAELERFQEQWEQNHFPIRRIHTAVREFREASTQTEEIEVKKEEIPCEGVISPPSYTQPCFWGIVKTEDFPHLPCYLPVWP